MTALLQIIRRWRCLSISVLLTPSDGGSKFQLNPVFHKFRFWRIEMVTSKICCLKRNWVNFDFSLSSSDTFQLRRLHCHKVSQFLSSLRNVNLLDANIAVKIIAFVTTHLIISSHWKFTKYLFSNKSYGESSFFVMECSWLKRTTIFLSVSCKNSSHSFYTPCRSLEAKASSLRTIIWIFIGKRNKVFTDPTIQVTENWSVFLRTVFKTFITLHSFLNLKIWDERNIWLRNLPDTTKYNVLSNQLCLWINVVFPLIKIWPFFNWKIIKTVLPNEEQDLGARISTDFKWLDLFFYILASPVRIYMISLQKPGGIPYYCLISSR